MLQPIDQRVAYEAISYTDYRTEPDIRDPYRSWNLAVPARSNPDTVALAVRMRAAARSDAAYVDAVLRKFNTEEFYYTLEPPALGRHMGCLCGQQLPEATVGFPQLRSGRIEDLDETIHPLASSPHYLVVSGGSRGRAEVCHRPGCGPRNDSLCC